MSSSVVPNRSTKECERIMLDAKVAVFERHMGTWKFIVGIFQTHKHQFQRWKLICVFGVTVKNQQDFYLASVLGIIAEVLTAYVFS